MKEFSFDEGLSRLQRVIDHMLDKNHTITLGIAGGSASGKSYFARLLCDIYTGHASHLPLDDYYLDSTHRSSSLGNNYDHPESFDLSLLAEHLHLLKAGRSIKKPIYRYTGKREGYELFYPQSLIVLDGLYSLQSSLLPCLDLKIFVEAPEEMRLERRLHRDIKERGKSSKITRKRWIETVEPMYKEYVLPQKRDAQLVILNSEYKPEAL
ncbi:MAG: hypothetical protein Q8R18_00690 [bacterium]|nr:hypothetical protein [bacterium]